VRKTTYLIKTFFFFSSDYKWRDTCQVIVFARFQKFSTSPDFYCVVKKKAICLVIWFVPAILATSVAEIRRIAVHDQPWQSLQDSSQPKAEYSGMCPISQATWKAETGRNLVLGQPWQKSLQDLISTEKAGRSLAHTFPPSYGGKHKIRGLWSRLVWAKTRLCLQNNQGKKGWDMVLMIEHMSSKKKALNFWDHMLSKWKAISSNHSTAKGSCNFN
jgi:hypothetical protein